MRAARRNYLQARPCHRADAAYSCGCSRRPGVALCVLSGLGRGLVPTKRISQPRTRWQALAALGLLGGAGWSSCQLLYCSNRRRTHQCYFVALLVILRFEAPVETHHQRDKPEPQLRMWRVRMELQSRRFTTKILQASFKACPESA